MCLKFVTNSMLRVRTRACVAAKGIERTILRNFMEIWEKYEKLVFKYAHILNMQLRCEILIRGKGHLVPREGTKICFANVCKGLPWIISASVGDVLYTITQKQALTKNQQLRKHGGCPGGGLGLENLSLEVSVGPTVIASTVCGVSVCVDVHIWCGCTP